MSAMELTFLGTGSAYPSPHRAASCSVLRSDVGLWMFDCGEGSQVQLMRSSLRPGRLTKIFITHLHGDHLFGLPGLLCTISQNCPAEKRTVDIYGPKGLRKFLRVALNLSRSMLGFQYSVHELEFEGTPGSIDGQTEWSPVYTASDEAHPQEVVGRSICSNSSGAWEVCRDGALSVFAAPLKHRVLCFGFVVVEDTLPGRLLVDRLKALGVPPGPLYAQLKRGERITAPDGTQVDPHDVMGPSRPGRKVVLLGDTADSSQLAGLAQEADVLVHESTNENAHEGKARENGHSSPAMAAAFAKLVGARHLILTHFSQRYRRLEDSLQPGEETVDRLLHEAEAGLTGDSVLVSLAEDFRTFAIPAKK